MRLPGLIRCPERSDGSGYRCDLPRFHPGRHDARPSPTVRCGWPKGLRETYEMEAPWITWTWLSSDRETRITGRMRQRLTCCVCGKREIVRIPIPRFGKITPPPDGVHPSRKAAMQRHAHPDRGAPMSWALPLRNPFGQPGGLDLDAFAMRLEADLNDGGDDG